MIIIVTIPFIDHEGGKRQRQILIRGIEIPDHDKVEIDMRDDEGFSWTPLTLIGGGRVEIRSS